jgi:hypothetical protein
MFAQAGQNIGQSIGGGISSLGKGVGGLLQGRADRKVEAEQAETVQKELKQYANDPAQLNSLGQKYQSQGKDKMAKMFFEAAKQATAKKATQVTSLENAGQDIQRCYTRNRLSQSLLQQVRVSRRSSVTTVLYLY